MIVTVRCLANLAEAAPPDGRLRLPAEATVGDAVRALRLPAGELGTVLRNGNPTTPDERLADQDALTCIPLISGG